MNSKQKGIFCLEGLWDTDLRKTSTVRPILELLRANCDIEYIYRDCATREEFEFYIKKWSQKTYNAYPVLYLAFHGEEFGLRIGSYPYDLDDLANLLEKKCYHRIIIFGSCSTLRVDKRHLKRFLRKTEALAICGYRTDIDWMRSAAFELLLLSEIKENKFDGRGIKAIERKVSEVAKLFREL
jgi:hypothetical protein